LQIAALQFPKVTSSQYQPQPHSSLVQSSPQGIGIVFVGAAKTVEERVKMIHLNIVDKNRVHWPIYTTSTACLYSKSGLDVWYLTALKSIISIKDAS
jgi:hypothetical protein